MDNPADLTILEAAARLRSGELTSVALTQAHIERIAERDGTYRAFITLTAERALNDARHADAEFAQGSDHGPLQGIPVALKDVIDTRGVRTTSGSRLRITDIPRRAAVVAARLAAGGAVLLGKLATYEMATVGPDRDGPFPPARNPWSLDHITGGSSSGSAAAVAGGLVRTTIASDTAGSIRGPAGYCGVVGLKPTGGLVGMNGVAPLSPSLDTLGVLSATVAEAAITLDAIADRRAAGSAARLIGKPLTGLRIGYAREWFATDPALEPAVLEAIDAAASELSLLGAQVGEMALPGYDGFLEAASTILNAESYAIHRADLETRPGDFGPMSRQSLLKGASLTSAEVEAARKAGRVLREETIALLAPFDVAITVCTLTTALPLASFEGGRTVWTPMRTIGFNLSGHPVLAVPVGFHRGLPIGMQIVGKHYDEALICSVGHAFEQATDHSAQRAPWHTPRPSWLM
jgi:aspartyl-tRNA(Asn)/glutamyl-tRNA(Gln) amidotransferase subunit A